MGRGEVETPSLTDVRPAPRTDRMIASRPSPPKYYVEHISMPWFHAESAGHRQTITFLEEQ
jgi:hypothetical protein